MPLTPAAAEAYALIKKGASDYAALIFGFPGKVNDQADIDLFDAFPAGTPYEEIIQRLPQNDFRYLLIRLEVKKQRSQEPPKNRLIAIYWEGPLTNSRKSLAYMGAHLGMKGYLGADSMYTTNDLDKLALNNVIEQISLIL